MKTPRLCKIRVQIAKRRSHVKSSEAMQPKIINEESATTWQSKPAKTGTSKHIEFGQGCISQLGEKFETTHVNAEMSTLPGMGCFCFIAAASA